MPITNIYGNGDYTAQIKLGSEGVAANVILDTGGSTLALDSSVYDPGADADMKPTSFVQDVTFVTGSFTGPVIQTNIIVGSGAGTVSANCNLTVTAEDTPGSFGSADGILGLAFNQLNSAYDLTQYLGEQGINPPDTYPWPFGKDGSSIALQQFTQLLSLMPTQDLKPYFSALTDAGAVRNIFSFYTLRSIAAQGTADPSSDPLNNGYFILGGGPEQSDLYTGDFAHVNIVDDLYYNTTLVAVQVQGADQEKMRKLPDKYAKSYKSNSIIDSGTNILALTSEAYNAIFSALGKINPDLASVAQQAQRQVIESASLSLEEWPDITFIMEGQNGEEVPLTCVPSTYWQLDSPAAGQATFRIANSGGVQSILGLPLLNNYYTVFDRSQSPYGVVSFAEIVPPA